MTTPRDFCFYFKGITTGRKTIDESDLANIKKVLDKVLTPLIQTPPVISYSGTTTDINIPEPPPLNRDDWEHKKL